MGGTHIFLWLIYVALWPSPRYCNYSPIKRNKLFFNVLNHRIKMNHSLTNSSLIAQLVKNPPAMQETPVQFLGWKDPMEKG